MENSLQRSHEMLRKPEFFLLLTFFRFARWENRHHVRRAAVLLNEHLSSANKRMKENWKCITILFFIKSEVLNFPLIRFDRWYSDRVDTYNKMWLKWMQFRKQRFNFFPSSMMSLTYIIHIWVSFLKSIYFLSFVIG